MAYCPKCGVEVNPGLRKCPLCSFDIPLIPGEEGPASPVQLKNYYDELKEIRHMKRIKARKAIFVILIIISIYVAMQILYQDWVMDEFLDYSFYVISSLGMFLFHMFFFLGLGRKRKRVLPLLSGVMAVFLFLSDLADRRLDWIFTLGLPVVIIVYGIPLLIILAASKYRLKAATLVSVSLLAVSLICLLLELIIELNLGTVNISWSINVILPCGSLALVIFLLKLWNSGDRSAGVKRFFHL